MLLIVRPRLHWVTLLTECIGALFVCVDLSMCMPQILIRKVIKLKAFSFFVPWVIVNLNQYISSLLVEICLWQIGKMVKCPICFLCERKKNY